LPDAIYLTVRTLRPILYQKTILVSKYKAVTMPATKDEIAEAFLGLAFRFGYRRTTIEDVARSLHISKKTVYESFGGKADLLAYAVELAAAEQRRRVESLLTAPTAMGRVQQVVSIALGDVRAFYASQPHPEMIDPPEITAQVNEHVYGPMVRELLVAGVEAGEFQVEDPDTFAAFIVAIGMEAVRMIREDPSSEPEPAMLAAVQRLVAGADSAQN
jgi:AcrR family transcriptional regulator